MQNYCPYCGQIHPDDFKFCPSTGKAIKGNYCEISEQNSEFQNQTGRTISHESVLEHYVMPPAIPEYFNIKLKNQEIKMILIPENKELKIASFYISETPITMEQYREVSNIPVDFIDYLERFHSGKYKDFTIAPAYTVKCMLDFFTSWKAPITITLPGRDQWLHIVQNHINQIKWYQPAEYMGDVSWNMMEWEVVDYESHDIYCLLGVSKTDGELVIKGNNFTAGEQRDNIAFRIMCSVDDAKLYIKSK